MKTRPRRSLCRKQVYFHSIIPDRCNNKPSRVTHRTTLISQRYRHATVYERRKILYSAAVRRSLSALQRRYSKFLLVRAYNYQDRASPRFVTFILYHRSQENRRLSAFVGPRGHEEPLDICNFPDHLRPRAEHCTSLQPLPLLIVDT